MGYLNSVQLGLRIVFRLQEPILATADQLLMELIRLSKLRAFSSLVPRENHPRYAPSRISKPALRWAFL